MNPLQKKCVLATAGFHLLLLVILFVGPGFFRHEPPPDNLPVLKVIPLGDVTDALTSGSSHATPVVTPPPPAPPVVTPPDPTPPPPQPTPAPEPPRPVVTHAPTPKVVVKPEPEEPAEAEKPVVTEHPDPMPKPVKKREVNLTLIKRHVPVKPKPDTSAQDEAAAEEKAAQADARRKARAFQTALNNIRENSSTATEIDTSPGDSSAAMVNYGQLVKSVYQNAWNPPDTADNDEASPRVKVVIANDGSVISAHIIEPSGDRALDASVQRTLDRVNFIHAFPPGVKETQRAYNIKFDLKAKRMLG